MLSFPYSMNDLKNRIVLNAPTIIKKYIMYDLNRRKNRKSAGCPKMSTAFNNGALFQILSKKNLFEQDDWFKQYPQCYDETMHEGRSSKAPHLLINVRRATNEGIRNSKALEFPNDAVNYYCMLNTKDLKSAGEQNILADFVMPNKETNDQHLLNALKKISTGVGYTYVIDGYLVNCKGDWSLNHLIEIKKQFPHVTTQYYPPYVVFSTKGSILIKYCEQYDCFFSPAETTFFNIKYPEYDLLSITAKEIGIDGLRKTTPAKITVTLNNMKGGVARISSDLHEKLLKNSTGITCYMKITDDEIEKILQYAVMSYNNDTTNFNKYYEKIKKFLNLNSELTKERDETNMGKAMRALYRMYPAENLLNECKKTGNTPFVYEHDITRASYIKKYNKIVFDKNNYLNQKKMWNLKLYAAFGNPNGSCIEDGVVIDSNILKHIPPIHYNACITIDFTFKTAKHIPFTKFITIKSLNDSNNNETLIGCLLTKHEAYVKNSKHNKITLGRLGKHYYYLIHFLPKRTRMYDNLNVRCVYNNNVITIVINGETKVNVGIGSKIANAYGQKNIISDVSDVLPEKCWGITKDGRKIHAQLIYNQISIISRLTAGQLYEMFTSNDLAISPTGIFIAPIDLVIHILHPYTNIKVFDVKVDTLTNINGFDSQNLSNVTSYLRKENVKDIILQILSLHGYNIQFECYDIEKDNITDININPMNKYYDVKKYKNRKIKKRVNLKREITNDTVKRLKYENTDNTDGTIVKKLKVEKINLKRKITTNNDGIVKKIKVEVDK